MRSKNERCPKCNNNDFFVVPKGGGMWSLLCPCGSEKEFFAPVATSTEAFEAFENKTVFPEPKPAGEHKEGTGFIYTVNVPEDFKIKAGSGGSGNIEFMTQEEHEQTHNHGIKDSGTRRQFESGAVRDMAEGKGRCDLLPLWVIARIKDDVFREMLFVHLDNYRNTGETKYLFQAIRLVIREFFKDDYETAILEVAIHFEEGAKKYAARNWEIGINVSSFIDSAIRHYLKHKRGDRDERHDRAALWNLICAVWTITFKSDLDDFRKGEEK